MAVNPLPPQAYTKETLLKAYAWMQNQNESIKNLATTPDILVSLFLKAKMNGDSILEGPSIQNFKSELKNLAGMMGEFESKVSRPAMSYQRPLERPAEPAPERHAEQLREQPRPPERPMPIAPDRPMNFDAETTSMERPPEAPAPSAHGWSLDYRSQTMIREVKNTFNLTSDQEALRMLISVGFKRMKTLE